MMNHPQVATETPITRADRPETYKNHYNKEAARGASFSIGKKSNIEIFYSVFRNLRITVQNKVFLKKQAYSYPIAEHISSARLLFVLRPSQFINDKDEIFLRPLNRKLRDFI